MLKAQGKQRILLTDDQRRLLAVKGKSLGRKALQELTTIVTPDTLLRWHRELITQKWDHSQRRKAAGRPRIRQPIVDLILRFAQWSEHWGPLQFVLPPRSPDLNAYIERFFKSLKTEALSRILFFGEKSLRRAVTSYLEHCHGERNHQGLGNKIIESGDEVGSIAGKIECRERLGGFLRYDHRKAA